MCKAQSLTTYRRNKIFQPRGTRKGPKGSKGPRANDLVRVVRRDVFLSVIDAIPVVPFKCCSG